MAARLSGGKCRASVWVCDFLIWVEVAGHLCPSISSDEAWNVGGVWPVMQTLSRNLWRGVRTAVLGSRTWHVSAALHTTGARTRDAIAACLRTGVHTSRASARWSAHHDASSPAVTMRHRRLFLRVKKAKLTLSSPGVRPSKSSSAIRTFEDRDTGGVRLEDSTWYGIETRVISSEYKIKFIKKQIFDIFKLFLYPWHNLIFFKKTTKNYLHINTNEGSFIILPPSQNVRRLRIG
jgi:hypothetical protein